MVAPNAGLFTLDGTRTFVLGESRVAVLDPGPDDRDHLERLAAVVRDADDGVILLTHGHPDHAAGVESLARATGFPVAGNVPGVDRSLAEGDRVAIDGGWLEAVETPGHARFHLAFLWKTEPPRDLADSGTGGDLFAGDLLLGEGETTWIGEYPGCVRDFFHSLDRVESLAPARIFPAHGPVLERPGEAIALFRGHRERRIQEVERAAAAIAPDRGAWAEDDGSLLAGLVDRVYGPDLPEGARMGATWSVLAILEYLGLAPFPLEGPPPGEGKRLAGGS